MSRFHEPGRCPDCGGPAGDAVRCPSCGLVLAGRVADDLRASLVRADQILDVLRTLSVQQPAAAAASTPAVTAAPASPTALPASPAAPAPAPRRGMPAVSVPIVLLGLGTVCVLVAAVVFVAVTWSDLSLAWRTAVLVLVTALATAAALWAVRVRLRGAAEALTLVAGGLLLIDLLAGNGTGLPVLSTVQGRPFEWLVSLVMAGTALAWVLGSRRVLGRALVGQQVVFLAAVLEMVRLAALGWPYDDAWVAAVSALLCTGAAAGLWMLRVPLGAVGCAVVAGLSWTYLAGAGLLRAATSDGPRDLFVGLDALPLLTAAVLAAVVAAASRVPSPARSVAGVLAVAGVAVVVLLPVRALPGTAAVLLVAAVALLLAGASRFAAAPWSVSLRVVGAGTVVLPGFVLVAGVSQALDRVAVALDPAWAQQVNEPLPEMLADSSSSAWVLASLAVWAFVPLGGLLAAAGMSALSADARGRTALVSGAAGAAVGALTALLWSSWPLLVVCSILLVVSAAGVVAYGRSPSRRVLGVVLVPVVLGVGTALASVAASAGFLAPYGVLLLVTATLSRALARSALAAAGVASLAVSMEALGRLIGLSAAVDGLLLLVCAVLVLVSAQVLSRRDDGGAWRRGLEGVAVPMAAVSLAQTLDHEVVRTVAFTAAGVATAAVAAVVRDRRSLACASVTLLSAGAAAAVVLAGGSLAWTAVAVSVVAGLGALTAQLLGREADAVAPERPSRYEPRVALELTSALLAVVSVSGQTDDPLAMTVGLTALGVSTILVSFVSADRRRLAWVGSVLLVLASWVRLSALDVAAVEAYTLPGALALLGAALVWFRRTPGATSWQAFAAPLCLGLAPSLAVALGDPTSLRALAVGLVGLALVLVGVRLRLGAPLVAGGVSVALLALVNIAPYAAALPRWVLFGTAGVALLVLGVTWERRRAELVTAQRYATRLR